jgi:serine/threonine-protein kinase
MVQVPAGPFWMGANVDSSPCTENAVDSTAEPNESPCHLVNVPAFQVDVYEVTVGEYADCVDEGPCTLPSNTSLDVSNWQRAGKEEHPINYVSWTQARAYCAWAGKRLCTEAEWEKAARGTEGHLYPWGDAPADCTHAIMNDGNWETFCGREGTQPVGSRPAGASPYGALDMAGNVFEWVEDGYHDGYAGAPTDGSAWLNPSDTRHVDRGGSYLTYAHYLRATFRAEAPSEDFVDNDLGFRCCRSD